VEEDRTVPIFTPPVKYVYLDVVGFSNGRSAEAQADIVGTINRIVLESFAKLVEEREQGILANFVQATALINTGTSREVLYFPTGDGLCVALLGHLHAYDAHLRLALRILEGVNRHNQAMKNTQRQFNIRIGLNENVDVIVTDINGQPNLAGAGINIAQRVMDFADGGQVLVSHAVHEILSYHEAYMDKFRAYSGTTKHQKRLPAFQYIDDLSVGLNAAVPTRFRAQQQAEPPLSLYEAYWFALALKYEGVFSALAKEDSSFLAGIMAFLHVLAEENYLEHGSSQFDRPPPWLEFNIGRSASVVAKHLYSISEHVTRWHLASLIAERLSSRRTYFQEPGAHYGAVFINAAGKDKLLKEQPTVADAVAEGKFIPTAD
jgi:class 3 adenylate cyclase